MLLLKTSIHILILLLLFPMERFWLLKSVTVYRSSIPDGSRSEPLEGAPEALEWGFTVDRLFYGFGWHLDVAVHPDYENNGWVYLHHTHPCRACMEDEDLLNKTVSKVIDMENP